MSRDTSLTDFGTSEDEADAESDEGAETEPKIAEWGADPGDESASLVGADADVEPSRATYDWTPDGTACACCGESVETRWRGDDGMVCADCKEW